MKIIDLISKLQALYNTYDDEYKSVMGEPEIVIDVFRHKGNHTFEYGGYGPEIVIEKTDCGTYDILNGFSKNETSNQKPKAKKSYDPSWPFPQGRKA